MLLHTDILFVPSKDRNFDKFYSPRFSLKGEKKDSTFIVVSAALLSMFLTELGEKLNPSHTSAVWKDFLQTSFWPCTFQALSLPLPT